MGKPKNLEGQKFGKLKVIRRDGSTRGNRNTIWLCECECKTQKQVLGCNLYNGTTMSCGCESLPVGEAAHNRLFRDYKDGARKRGLSFDLSRTNFLDLINKNCRYCNSRPNQSLLNRYKNSKKSRLYETTQVYNGIDRLDNTKGYTPANCVPCCKICNRAKWDISYEDFHRWLRRLVTFYGGTIL